MIIKISLSRNFHLQNSSQFTFLQRRNNELVCKTEDGNGFKLTHLARFLFLQGTQAIPMTKVLEEEYFHMDCFPR